MCHDLRIQINFFVLSFQVDRNAEIQRENMKKKRREMEQASMDAASDLLDTDSNATFAMVSLQRR